MTGILRLENRWLFAFALSKGTFKYKRSKTNDFKSSRLYRKLARPDLQVVFVLSISVESVLILVKKRCASTQFTMKRYYGVTVFRCHGDIVTCYFVTLKRYYSAMML